MHLYQWPDVAEFEYHVNELLNQAGKKNDCTTGNKLLEAAKLSQTFFLSFRMIIQTHTDHKELHWLINFHSPENPIALAVAAA